jgi:hypothetical protein
MERAEAIRRQENWHFDDASVRSYIRSTAHGFPDYCFRADHALVQDKAFKKYAVAYAADEALFFKELVPSFTLARLYFLLTEHTCSFSAVIAKLFELGVPESQWVTSEPWIMSSTNEQQESK